jgi:hypothetical protein
MHDEIQFIILAKRGILAPNKKYCALNLYLQPILTSKPNLKEVLFINTFRRLDFLFGDVFECALSACAKEVCPVPFVYDARHTVLSCL